MGCVRETKGGTKTYKNQAVVNKVSLSVEKREIYGFIGPNGAGKSTTIKIMLNFIYADQGQVRLLGLDNIKDAKKIRQRTGYVSRDVHFYPDFTALQTLREVVAFHQLKNSEQKLNHYIDLFEIDSAKKMGELSLGNKKKIAIVSGLLMEPELLILDEPTNGLNSLMQHRPFEVLEEKNKQGMIIFLSSHDLNEIQQHAHRAAFIRKGEIMTIGDVTKEMHLGKVITLAGDHTYLQLFLSSWEQLF